MNRSWKDFTNASVTDASELSQKTEIALKHYDRRKQEVPFLAWLRWVKCKQESRVGTWLQSISHSIVGKNVSKTLRFS